MAYGTNAPFGLRPLFTQNGGSAAPATSTYQIYANSAGTSTYANSIFTGDPLVWGISAGATPTTNGLIGTVAVQPSIIVTFQPVLGVFAGCEYYDTTMPVNNLIQSAYWPGSTNVGAGTQITAYAYTDPSIVYDIQVSTSVNAIGTNFAARPIFPNTNPTVTGGVLSRAGSSGSNFILTAGGGTNFNAVTIGGSPAGYANNPATGSTTTGQSAFYLNVNTSATVGTGDSSDYAKNTSSLAVKPIGYTDNVLNVPRTNPFGAATMALTPFLNVMVILNNSKINPFSTLA